MSDMKSETEMPTGAMEEVTPTDAPHTPARKAGRKSQATTASSGDVNMGHLKPEAEMQPSAMEEAARAGAFETPANMTLENAGELFRATANISIPELLGAIPQQVPPAAEPRMATAPSVGKMPGEADVKPMEHGGKMPGE
jgi:hypothetical protein